MSKSKKGDKSEKPRKPFRPSQAKLPGFTDKDQEELEGVLEHYKTVEDSAKGAMKEVNDREKTRIDHAALEVIRVMSKHKRKSVIVNGFSGQILSTLKVKVKRAKKIAKAEKGAAPAGKAAKKRPTPKAEIVKSPAAEDSVSSESSTAAVQ